MLQYLFNYMVECITAKEIVEGKPHESFTYFELASFAETLGDVAGEWKRQRAAAGRKRKKR